MQVDCDNPPLKIFFCMLLTTRFCERYSPHYCSFTIAFLSFRLLEFYFVTKCKIEYSLMVQLINSLHASHIWGLLRPANCSLSQLWFVVVYSTPPLLLNVNFNLVKGSFSKRLTTHSELEVIGGGLGELLAEPWRTVE